MSGVNGEKTSEIEVRWAPGCLLEALDRRTTLYRRVRERMDAIAGDLGGWGALSTSQAMLVERAVWLEHWLQAREAQLAEGADSFDVRAYTQATYALATILGRLGLKRRARDVSLRDVLRRDREARE